VQIPVPFRAFQGHPVRSTNTIAFMASRSGTRGLWQPSGCGGGEGSSGCIFTHSSSGILQRSSLATRPMQTGIARFGCRGQFLASFTQPRTLGPGRRSLMDGACSRTSRRDEVYRCDGLKSRMPRARPCQGSSVRTTRRKPARRTGTLKLISSPRPRCAARRYEITCAT
jgi:hypothetical protein